MGEMCIKPDAITYTNKSPDSLCIELDTSIF